jgi:diguanylate cyclase (GGDEF)-like protein/PAS domain S-box-containing protein
MERTPSPGAPDRPGTQSINSSVTLLVALFLLVIGSQIVLVSFGVGVLASVRAYMGGEGLWSKAEKDAVHHLIVFLSTRQPDDYRRFRATLAVPLGDRKARLELEKPDFSKAAAREGFLEGRNHPEDVDGMIQLFRRFRRVDYLDRAISIWEQGDGRIRELEELGERIRADVEAGGLPEERRIAYLHEIERLDDKLTLLEDSFSATLGQAARWLGSVLMRALLLITGLLVGIAVVVAFRIGRFLIRQDHALRSSERRYRPLFERNLAGLYRSTLDGRILDCNSAFARILGYPSRDEVLKLTAWDLYAEPADREALLARLKQQSVLVNFELCLKRKDGSTVWVLANENLLENELGSEPVMEGSLIDISDRKRAEEQSRYQANHDALTDLPNRVLFNDRLELAILHAHRRKQKLAVLFLDLDYFKHVNDSLGHSAGDTLLVQVATRLKRCLREDDTVARLGGDEFVVLLTGLTRESDVGVMANKLLATLLEPFEVQKREIFLAASIGIALYPTDGTDVETLLKNVDTAMYRAKETGRNSFQYFTAAMQNQAQERALLESGLRHALPRSQFVLHYQPLLDLKSRRIVGVEALVRWQHPEKGLLQPMEFIPLAEDIGLIVPFGEWVLNEACRQAKTWQENGFPWMRVAVNLSARQFRNPGLVASIRGILEATGLDSKCLDLEITESIAMQNMDRTGRVLRELTAMGIRISMDDFGTGHSSLSYLKHFPIHRLKIDQSFISGIERDVRDRAIVSAIITVAHHLDLRVTAEGVETPGQAQLLGELACDDVQGFLFGRPMPEEQLTGILLETVAAKPA